MNTQIALLLAWLSAAVVLAAVLHGGIYQAVRGGEDRLYVVNRITGATELCVGIHCTPTRATARLP